MLKKMLLIIWILIVNLVHSTGSYRYLTSNREKVIKFCARFTKDKYPHDVTNEVWINGRHMFSPMCYVRCSYDNGELQIFRDFDGTLIHPVFYGTYYAEECQAWLEK